MGIRFVSLIVIVLCPTAAAGQTLARTFADLLAMLSPRDRIIVTDVAGREMVGPVESVSPQSFTMAVTEKTATGTRTGAERRTFREAEVSSVRRVGEAGAAGPIIYPVTWDRVHALPAGSLVRVSLAGGETHAYRFTSASADALMLTTESSQSQVFSKASITRVVREQHRDPVANGIAIGLAIGAGGAAALTATAYATCGETCDAPARLPFYASTMAFGAGIGAAAGWIIDRLHKGSDLVFPVTAVVRPGQKAMYVSVRF